MKQLFLFVGIFASLFANSQELEKSLLWKISGNGLKSPSYLFGTIHATCDATLDAKTIKALDDTAQLFLELDMDDPAMQTEMMKYIKMNGEEKLSALVSAEDFETIDAFLLKNMSFSAKMIEEFKPFMISAMLLPKLLDCEFKSVESELMRITKEQKEEVYGLEKVEDQMKAFDAIPYKTQAEELLKTAKNGLEKSKIEFQKMMDSYNNKDIEAMLAMMDDPENKMTFENKDVLLNNRNKNWIPVIAKVAKEKPTFFGVGAAHLAGEEGVIKLLRKAGYKVQAVK
ncbi:TraB/GumN family protein [Flavobacterium ardleyense]|uniref:TraB/GumN family protein n=1 Tax=Flavobacterium ardleyense TaxID=2038737 RepID=A0ABW5Z9X2_9FLAO